MGGVGDEVVSEWEGVEAGEGGGLSRWWKGLLSLLASASAVMVLCRWRTGRSVSESSLTTMGDQLTR